MTYGLLSFCKDIVQYKMSFEVLLAKWRLLQMKLGKSIVLSIYYSRLLKPAHFAVQSMSGIILVAFILMLEEEEEIGYGKIKGKKFVRVNISRFPQ